MAGPPQNPLRRYAVRDPPGLRRHMHSLVTRRLANTTIFPLQAQRQDQRHPYEPPTHSLISLPCKFSNHTPPTDREADRREKEGQGERRRPPPAEDRH